MAVAVTLATLKTSVGYRLDDEDFVLYSAGRVTHFLNRAIDHVQSRLNAWGGKALVASTDVSLVAGTTSYAIDDEIMQIEKVTVVRSDGSERALQPIPLNQAEVYQNTPLIGTNGWTPAVYTKQGNALRVWPTPQEAATMRVYYTAMKNDLSADADALTLPPWCRSLIEAHAAAFLCSTKGDRKVKEMLEADLARLEMEFEYQLAKWQNQEPEQVRDRWAEEFGWTM